MLPVTQPWPAHAQHPASCPAPTLFPGYRELPDLEPDALQKQADHCNDSRMASKRVQELSTGLFFAILVKVRPPAWQPLPLTYPTSPPGCPGGEAPVRSSWAFGSWGGPWG